MVMATVTEAESTAIPSVKDLASSEPSLRRQNLKQIISHLETRSPTDHLTHTQALQLWRGFHVSLYMHDSKNQLSVQTLIATLASTFKLIRSKDIDLQSKKSSSPSDSEPRTSKMPNTDEFAGFDDDDDDDNTPTLPPSRTTQPDISWLTTYTTAFWETIAREWSGIDQWRMNKFLLLIRFALREIFSICLSSYFGVEDNNEPDHSSSSTTSATSESESKSKKRKITNNKTTTNITTITTTTVNDDDVTSHQSKKLKSSPQRQQQQQQQQSSPSSSIPQPSITTTTTTHPTTSQLTILSLHPLSPRNRTTPDGLRLHLLDIYLDELTNSVPATVKSDGKAVVVEQVIRDEFLAPVKKVAEEGVARNVRMRAKEVVREFEERCEEEKDDDDDEGVV